VSDIDDKLRALAKLQGLAAVTGKTVKRILPSARSVSQQKTEVVCGLFLFFLTGTVGSLGMNLFKVIPSDVSLALFLPCLLGMGLTGGIFGWRLVPRNRRLEREENQELMKDEIEDIERKSESKFKRAFSTKKSAAESEIFIEHGKQLNELAMEMRRIRFQALAGIVATEDQHVRRDTPSIAGSTRDTVPRLPPKTDAQPIDAPFVQIQPQPVAEHIHAPRLSPKPRLDGNRNDWR